MTGSVSVSLFSLLHLWFRFLCFFEDEQERKKKLFLQKGIPVSIFPFSDHKLLDNNFIFFMFQFNLCGGYFYWMCGKFAMNSSDSLGGDFVFVVIRGIWGWFSLEGMFRDGFCGRFNVIGMFMKDVSVTEFLSWKWKRWKPLKFFSSLLINKMLQIIDLESWHFALFSLNLLKNI